MGLKMRGDIRIVVTVISCWIYQQLVVNPAARYPMPVGEMCLTKYHVSGKVQETQSHEGWSANVNSIPQFQINPH